MTTPRSYIPAPPPAARTALRVAVAQDTPGVPCLDPTLDPGAWTAEGEGEQRMAGAVCRAAPCPALAACRAYGIAYPDEVGTYGGLTQAERRHHATTDHHDDERKTA